MRNGQSSSTSSSETQAAQEAAVHVANILAAPDHYAAIAARRDASTAELRQNFLKASVRVHPDKNQHPDATRAFQKVSAAWAVLGDLDARRRYDEVLRHGDRPQDVPVGEYEAYNAFAFATAAAAAAGSSGDFADTMLWAQQLAAMQRERMRQCQAGEGAEQSPPSDAERIGQAAGGLAFSATLVGVGLTLGACGWPVLGSLTKRMGVFQGISQVASATMIPTVQEKAMDGFTKVSKEAGFLKDKIKEGGTSYMAILQDALPSEVSERFTGNSCVPSFGRSLSRSHGSDSDESEGSTSGDSSLRPGFLLAEASPPTTTQIMRIAGLQSEAGQALNGRLCEVMSRDEATGRMAVRLLPPAALPLGADAETVSSEKKLIREENLEGAVSKSSEPPSVVTAFV